MTSRILVTGGLGLIGSHLAIALVAAGHRVRILDRRESVLDNSVVGTSVHELDEVEFFQGDVRDGHAVTTALHDIDVIYHLAAMTSVDESMAKPEEYLDNNVEGTRLVATLARDRVARFILSSSRAVYGEGMGDCRNCGRVVIGKRNVCASTWEPTCPVCQGPVSVAPCTESTPLLPSSVYGMSKMLQEREAQRCLNASSSELVTLRYFNVYGRRVFTTAGHDGVVDVFLKRATFGTRLVLLEDGGQIRDFIDIDDVTEANVRAMACAEGVFNVGTGVGTTLLKLANDIARLVNTNVRVTFEGRGRIGDIRHSLAEVEYTGAALQWRSKVELEDGLRKFASSIAS